MTIRRLRNISHGGFSIVTDRPAPSDVTVDFEFSTTSRPSIIVPARMAYGLLDAEGHWYVSGWQFPSQADVTAAVATIVGCLGVN